MCVCVQFFLFIRDAAFEPAMALQPRATRKAVNPRVQRKRYHQDTGKKRNEAGEGEGERESKVIGQLAIASLTSRQFGSGVLQDHRYPNLSAS